MVYPSHNLEQLILKRIDHVKHASKRKVSLDSILQRINKSSTTNFDNDTLKFRTISNDNERTV